MHYPGKFTDSILPDQLSRISLSFLVDDLVIRRGGVAPNICFAMGLLGVRPILIGAVGADWADYESWLERHGVDVSHVKICHDVQTARFVCTTDDDMNQIATFYAGAMARAREIELGPVAATAAGGLEFVMISADDPDAMVRHAEECRFRGIKFAADPSQQLARMDGAASIALVTGAELLFSNDYELGMLKAKTGWDDADILDHVGYRVTTLGAAGIEIVASPARGGERIHVLALPETGKVDPTGVGDGFRGGFLAGRARGLSLERSAQLGALLATLVLETVGTQEYQLDWKTALPRLRSAYGDDVAGEILTALGVAAG
ncbi:carbohydrate kinase family protein [Nakamurella antarctica]|uniref:Carbohydrate kinase family protein n=1 Tax=Nakamurella antarctica TaxID=1902245 RepID=A0A3G8ZQL1_9ACTN|nr:carbohydrate kinase family protein [Nakamurella antarctica]